MRVKYIPSRLLELVEDHTCGTGGLLRARGLENLLGRLAGERGVKLGASLQVDLYVPGVEGRRRSTRILQQQHSDR